MQRAASYLRERPTATFPCFLKTPVLVSGSQLSHGSSSKLFSLLAPLCACVHGVQGIEPRAALLLSYIPQPLFTFEVGSC